MSRIGLPVSGVLLLICCGCTAGLLQLPEGGLTTRLAGLTGTSDRAEGDGGRTEEDDFETRMETPLLGDYISVQGNTLVPLRGIGLVMELNGTGGTPPPSSLRRKLLEEMARLDVPGPSAVLARRDTALVIVTAYLPANARKGQRFDVRVALPPNSEATSLKGGYLLPTRLFEEAEIRGAGTKRGHEYAVAEGPILCAFGADDRAAGSRGLLARGSIPGGAVSKTDRDMEIVLRKRFQSIRKSKQIADAIGSRFHYFDRFNRRIPVAEAKTHALVRLKSHPLYRNNFPRYHQVIRHIPLADTPVARRLRMETLARELLEPATAEKAALQLEALGSEAKPFLRAGLRSPWSDVRFFSAEALAYLGDRDAVDVLAAAARDEPAFRIYAFAALSNMTSSAQALLALRSLLHEQSLETRYGALRAITEIDDSDRSLKTVRYRKRFVLRQISPPGPPAVHLTRRRLPEITIFNDTQELLLPAVLNGGHRIRVIGRDGEDTVTVTRYEVGRDPVRRTCSRRLAEIIRTAGELGAYYSDIVQLILEAEKQHNLEGELGIDRLPQAGRSYTSRHDSQATAGQVRRRAGTAARTPGIFERIDSEDSAEDPSANDAASAGETESALRTHPPRKSPASAEADAGETAAEGNDAAQVDSARTDARSAAGTPAAEDVARDAGSQSGPLKRLLTGSFESFPF